MLYSTFATNQKSTANSQQMHIKHLKSKTNKNVRSLDISRCCRPRLTACCQTDPKQIESSRAWAL